MYHIILLFNHVKVVTTIVFKFCQRTQPTKLSFSIFLFPAFALIGKQSDFVARIFILSAKSAKKCREAMLIVNPWLAKLEEYRFLSTVLVKLRVLPSLGMFIVFREPQGSVVLSFLLSGIYVSYLQLSYDNATSWHLCTTRFHCTIV